MATKRQPWPAEVSGTYYELGRQAKKAQFLIDHAQRAGHSNVYRLAELLSKISAAGQRIVILCREAENRRAAGDRWPRWTINSLNEIRLAGRNLSGGARHALEGLNEDNWKKVGVGLAHCQDHAGRVEMRLTDGPGPSEILAEAEKILSQVKE